MHISEMCMKASFSLWDIVLRKKFSASVLDFPANFILFCLFYYFYYFFANYGFEWFPSDVVICKQNLISNWHLCTSVDVVRNLMFINRVCWFVNFIRENQIIWDFKYRNDESCLKHCNYWQYSVFLLQRIHQTNESQTFAVHCKTNAISEKLCPFFGLGTTKKKKYLCTYVTKKKKKKSLWFIFLVDVSVLCRSRQYYFTLTCPGLW